MTMTRVAGGFRLRLHHLLLLVLFAGTAMGAERAWNRHRICLDRAAYHAAEEARCQRLLVLVEADLARQLKYDIGYCGNARGALEARKWMREKMRKEAVEHASRRDRFLHAASRPWVLCPEPDSAGVPAS